MPYNLVLFLCLPLLPSVILLNAIRLSVILMHALLPSVILLNAIRLSVAAAGKQSQKRICEKPLNITSENENNASFVSFKTTGALTEVLASKP